MCGLGIVQGNYNENYLWFETNFSFADSEVQKKEELLSPLELLVSVPRVTVEQTGFLLRTREVAGLNLGQENNSSKE